MPLVSHFSTNTYNFEDSYQSSFYNPDLLSKNTKSDILDFSFLSPVKQASHLLTLLESQKNRPAPISVIKSGPFEGGSFVAGTIRSNFYVDARRSGVPAGIIDSIINKLSSKIDFRHSLKKGDKFEVAFNGKRDLLYAKITTKYKEASVYKCGKEGYFFANGDKITASKNNNTFGLPLKGGIRVSSHYGYRKHPVTGRYSRHTGVDLIASYGTPVYAVFDGVVTRASRYSGYGNCIDIRHASGYSSRYGHLSRFAVHSGTRVKKGQVIAYTGSTGVSTGPHLHLELARNNVPINPLSVKMLPEITGRVSSMYKLNNLKAYCKKLINNSGLL